jgi:anthranilate phosphoribosyltransferase
VHGSGIDEITNTGETLVSELRVGNVRNYKISPEDFGYPVATVDEIAGTTPYENARALVKIMKGEHSSGRDIVAMNTAAALYVADRAESLDEGCRIAEEAIDSGSSLETLKKLVKMYGDPEKLRRFL